MASDVIPCDEHRVVMASDVIPCDQHRVVMASDVIPCDQHRVVMASDVIPRDQHRVVMAGDTQVDSAVRLVSVQLALPFTEALQGAVSMMVNLQMFLNNERFNQSPPTTTFFVLFNTNLLLHYLSFYNYVIYNSTITVSRGYLQTDANLYC